MFDMPIDHSKLDDILALVKKENYFNYSEELIQLPQELIIENKIKSLTLGHNNFDIFPHEIQYLTKLEELSYEYNNTKEMHKTISKLTHLTKLSLSQLEIEKNTLQTIYTKLINLEELTLYEVSCNNKIPDDIKNLKKLTSIVCESLADDITYISEELYNLRNLKQIVIAYAGEDSYDIPDTILNLSNLKEFHFIGNISKKSIELLKKHPTIQKFTL